MAMAAVAVGVAAAQQRVLLGPLARAEELTRHKLDRVGEQRRGGGDDGGPREVGPPQAGVLLSVCSKHEAMHHSDRVLLSIVIISVMMRFWQTYGAGHDEFMHGRCGEMPSN
jgi:hypothetical protein